jgi:hypothetical protein
MAGLTGVDVIPGLDLSVCYHDCLIFFLYYVYLLAEESLLAVSQPARSPSVPAMHIPAGHFHVELLNAEC